MQKIKAMRKVLLSFLIGCMGFIYGHASTAINLDGSPKQTPPPVFAPPQTGNPGDDDIDRPHLRPGLWVKFETTWLEYDSCTSTLFVHTPDGEGQILVGIYNLFTGEFCSYSYDASTHVLTIPFMEGEGTWRLCLYVTHGPYGPGTLFRCHFTIENGMLVYQ